MRKEDESPRWGTPDSKQAALLTQYREVREEIRMELQSYYKLMTQGIVGLGLVTGYALSAGEFVFLSFVPAVMAFLFLLSTSGWNSVLVLAWHAAEIESELPYEAFSWERRYGGAVSNNRRTALDPWETFPVAAVIGVGVVVYVVFLYVGYASVRGAGYDPVLGVPVSDLLAAAYALLTVIAAIAGYAHLRMKEKIRRRVGSGSDPGGSS